MKEERMHSAAFAFRLALSRHTLSSVKSPFVTTGRGNRRSPSFAQRNKADFRQPRFPRCDLGSETGEYIVDADGSEFDMDEDEIDLEEVDFPVGIPMLNSLQLTGRLGADPVLRTVRDGLEVCKFSLAVQHEYDPSADPEDTTSWFDVEVWGSLGRSVASRVKKGLRVGIIGSIDVNVWTNRDGEMVESPVVTATSVEVLQSRSEAMPMGDKRMKPKQFNEGDTAGYDANSKYSGIQIDGDLRDLPF